MTAPPVGPDQAHGDALDLIVEGTERVAQTAFDVAPQRRRRFEAEPSDVELHDTSLMRVRPPARGPATGKPSVGNSRTSNK
jgi:hypothetical protein